MENILNIIIEFINDIGIYGGILSSLILMIESIFPFIPLFVFVTINFYIFGNILGFITSWFFTIIGCILSYCIFRYGLGNKFNYLIRDKEQIKKYKDYIKNISLTKLMVIVSIPFTPAFIVNIVCGLCKTDFKKYILSLIIGKLILIYYSFFLGDSLLNSFKNPMVLLKLFIIIFGVYVLSKILNKLIGFKE